MKWLIAIFLMGGLLMPRLDSTDSAPPQPPKPPMGWHKLGQYPSTSPVDPTGGAHTGYKHGRVNRSKRRRK